MSKIKNAYADILNCTICNGLGYQGWANGEDFDIEWCDCNPQHLTIDEDYLDTLTDTCSGCNENAVSWNEIYCYTCYLAKNAEIDYAYIDQLFITQEAK